MNLSQLDNAIVAIIEKKKALSKLSYDDKNYDKIEEELHNLEDDFVEKYGDYMEDVLQDIHDELCPDNDVLLPIAYFANNYQETGKNPDGSTIYDVDYKEGVFVDTDKYPGKDTRLVLLPNPVRVVLLVGGQKKEVVWKGK
ncbi:MAG: hypothetical protein ACK40G_17445 [Cytophagaceae bacterium]